MDFSFLDRSLLASEVKPERRQKRWLFRAPCSKASGTRRLEHNQRGREGRARGGAAKPKAALNELHFVCSRDVVVPPTGVSASWKKTHNRGSSGGTLERLLNPLADVPAIGRIHPARTTPFLLEPIVHRRVELLALRVC